MKYQIPTVYFLSVFSEILWERQALGEKELWNTVNLQKIFEFK